MREISIQACEVLDQITGKGNTEALQHAAPSAVAAIFLKIASLVQPPTAAAEATPSQQTKPLPTPNRAGSVGSASSSNGDPLTGALSSLFSLTPFNYSLSNEPSYTAPYTTTNLHDIPLLSTLGSAHGQGGHPPVFFHNSSDSAIAMSSSASASNLHHMSMSGQSSTNPAANNGRILGLDLLAMSTNSSHPQPQPPQVGSTAQVPGGVGGGPALFDEGNQAAREFLASFAHPIATPASGNTPNGGPGSVRATGIEWDLSELVGPEWL